MPDVARASDGSQSALACDAVLSRLYELSEHVFAPVLLPGINVELHRNPSTAFNARVGRTDGQGYAVNVFDGYVSGLLGVLDEAFAHETISDSISGLSATLIGPEVAPGHLQRFIRDCAVLFAIFHEFAHISCGHFQLRHVHRLVCAEDGILWMDEVDDTLADAVAKNEAHALVKHIELEADAIAYDFLFTCGYELLLQDDEIVARLAQVHQADQLPKQSDLALAEVMLFAGAAACFLIEAHHNTHSVYPSPQSRVLSLALQAAVRFVRHGEDAPAGTRLPLDDELRKLLADFAARVLNALEFGEACFEAVRGPRAAAGADTTLTEAVLARDLLGLLLESDLKTTAAVDLRTLIAGRAAFEAVSNGYRIGVLGAKGGGTAHA